MIDYLTLPCPSCGDLYQAEHRDVQCPTCPAPVVAPSGHDTNDGA